MEFAYCWPYPRRHLTKEKKISLLKRYKESLEKELKGVEERIKELGGEV